MTVSIYKTYFIGRFLEVSIEKAYHSPPLPQKRLNLFIRVKFRQLYYLLHLGYKTIY
jgi:hypothetical protein